MDGDDSEMSEADAMPTPINSSMPIAENMAIEGEPNAAAHSANADAARARESEQAALAAKISMVATEVTTAALVKMGLGGEGQVATVTVEEVESMKVAELKLALVGRGLTTGGKKAELAGRLTDALKKHGQEREGMHVEDEGEGEEDEGEGEQLAVVVRAKTPAEAAAAAGVEVEWHLLRCPLCKAGLQARLPAPMTKLCCGFCSGTFFAANPLVTKRAPERKSAKRESWKFRSQNLYVKKAYARIRAADPKLTHRQVFKAAMEEHRALSKEERQALVAEAAAADEHEARGSGSPAAAAGTASEREEERDRVDDGERDGERDSERDGVQAAAAGARPAAAAVENLAVDTPPVVGPMADPACVQPLPPPAILPLAQRPHPKRDPGAKKLKGRARPEPSPWTAPEPARKRPKHATAAAVTAACALASAPAPARASGRKRKPKQYLGESDADEDEHDFE